MQGLILGLLFFSPQKVFFFFAYPHTCESALTFAPPFVSRPLSSFSLQFPVMGNKSPKVQYATPYGAYGPRVGQIPAHPSSSTPPPQLSGCRPSGQERV